MVTRRRLIAVAAAAVLAASAGCANTVSETPPVGAAAQQSPAGYPVVIENCGEEYTFPAPPERTVVMNGGSVAEVSSMLALGLGDRIVANAQDYGASEVDGRQQEIEALSTGGLALNESGDIPREAMLALRPDFVLATYDGGFSADLGHATRDELRRLGANSYVPARSCGPTGTVDGEPVIEDGYELITDLGTIFDVPERAEEVIAQSRAAIAEIEAQVAGAAEKNVLVLFVGMSMGSGGLGDVGATGIWNDVLARAGAVNAFGDASEGMFADVSREHAAQAAVDGVVIVSYRHPDPESEARRLFDEFPQWAAARDEDFVVLSDSIYLGPSNAEAVEAIARMAHPERF
ncbi:MULTISPECIES: ABC transporter substrate-binding protein [Actinoalloteichus]|uniref:ABC-type Fe3+-hydroxamate transport system, periplasmic component n=1 Tax=Actinoalloteichus fjordicus TaxID=1612552 RepID=A0AAC9LEV2_9PSEU|nr:MULTISPECIES: ABC transporter substrate-binding protein [Actinoalloteichus]APU15467.1 ABC-type Fe3+-hydroxamate transport system, periplasmic component [Actinoalloteichus fjordicus]APU21535.1 ABC-type Fe3+-hydroxamate transport system, periplasmic component [Actinoalloteichus sp. GBA129-24]